jgi:predicted Zn-dependent peptidase
MSAFRDPRRMEFPKLKVTPRIPHRVLLRNGIPCFLLETRELPVVQVGMFLRAGHVFDPPGKLTLSAMTGNGMRMGGGGPLVGDALDEELDFMGSSLGGRVEQDHAFMDAWCLKRNLGKTLAALADMVRRPAFPGDKVELARMQELEWMKRRWDEPRQAANLMFGMAVYGNDNPWGRVAVEEHPKAVTLDDIRACHARFARPGGAVLMATGDFDRAEMAKLLDKTFGDWEGGPPDLPPFPRTRFALPGGVYLVPRDIGQSNFRIGHLGIRLDDPDYFSLRMMDMILGSGSMSTRLFQDIRSRRGLAYSIWSRNSARIPDIGTFHIGGETKYESLEEALRVCLGHMKDIGRKPVTDKELKLARDTYDNGYAFEFQSSWGVVWRHSWYELWGLPQDWLFTERRRILAAGKKEIMEAARKHLHPGASVILVVGDPKKCRDTLAKFGEVRELPIPG